MHGVVTTWVCDRDPSHTKSIATGEPPNGWRVVRAEPVTAIDLKGGEVRADGDVLLWEVCEGCASQLGRLMLGPKASHDG